MQNITYKNTRSKDKSLNINKAIKAKEVRLIGDNADTTSLLPIEEALKMAFDLGLDLVEVNANNSPPICKIIDYGKYKFLQQQKAKEAKKKQKKIITKKLAIHLNIGIHDYTVKLKHAIAHITEGNTVELAVELRGREMEYHAKAKDLLDKFYNDLGGENFAKLNNQPKLEGRRVVAIFAPAG